MLAAIHRTGFLKKLAVLSGFLLAHALGLTVRAAEVPTTAGEESMKAALTSIILRTSWWPDDAFDTRTSDFRIGIIGKKPPIKEFKAAFDGLKISKRKVTVVVLDGPEDAADLHAIYFSDAGTKQMKATLAAIAGQPTISFAYHDDFISMGGTFNYWKVNNDHTIHFEFNRTSMEHSDVRVSAQVIRVALSPPPEEEK